MTTHKGVGAGNMYDVCQPCCVAVFIVHDPVHADTVLVFKDTGVDINM